ncbi:MAG: bifunctional (p)ppGpp synthetase/guanosine-3',5'-bis(diphosphate) 3'-pyrophosphohydrolase [Deltaproteobacteria bacterium]|nr:bifunctional (p)ppGpp synthetase/guanosine-3',5'-bis(diphosphate) 3'-pyrophosphohydrolase [Deltaproteobacteria bacterium]
MANRIIRLQNIVEEVLKHHPEEDTSLIEKAYVFSAKAHEGQLRLSGEPYLSHPLEVAYFLAQMGLGPVTVSAGLLHDTVEDSAATLDDLEEYFGDEVTDVVNGVTKIGQLTFGDRQTQQAEYIRKMILSMSHDIRVLLVKLADRVHNMRTLEYMEANKRRRIARETLEIYAPLAGRLGMFRLKAELEDLSFFYLEPEAYQQLQEGLSRKRGDLEKYIQDICQLLREKLEENRLKGEVSGRLKNYYSIYRKLQAQQITLDELYDLLAFRIIVDSVAECYETLGVIHAIFRPVPGRLKDYIGMPKANMYQSIHTTVIGRFGERLEIQIRTREMHRVAEEGIAAHWSYKERRAYHEKDAQRFSWLKQMVDLQKELKSPEELLEGVRLELYPEEVYVFTPTGDVKELPRGATLVDFAYAIHTEVGNRCTGAKVNGRMLPLRTELQNGDTVEIITSPHHHPSRDWLQFVKTTKARHKIRAWLKAAEREQSIALGKELLERELRKSGASLQKLLKEGDELRRVTSEFSFVGIDDLLAAIGHGKLSPGQITGKLFRVPQAPEEVQPEAERKEKPPEAEGSLRIKDLDDMLVRLANCCQPIPGDAIMGYITRGQGVTIHRSDCPYLASTESFRHIPAEWDGGGGGKLYPVRIQVVSVDKPGLLADITSALKSADVNVTKAAVETTQDHKGIAKFTIQVADQTHLDKVFGSLKRLKEVISVRRLTG